MPRADRAKALGWLSAATSAGVMIGPAIGSLAAAWGVLGPGYVAAGLCVLNMIFASIWLPESNGGRKDASKEAAPRRATSTAMLEVLRQPTGALGSLVWIYSAGMMAFMAMNGVLALFLERRYDVDETTIGWFYVYVGAVSLIMRSFLLGPAIKRFGEVGSLRLGALAMAIGLGALPLARNLPELAVAVLLMPVGTALLFPATTSLVSHRAPENQTGLYLGVQQSFGGVSRMIGPLWAGAAFQHLGIAVPFFIAAALMLVVRLFSSVVRSEGSDEAVPPVAEPVPPTDPA